MGTGVRRKRFLPMLPAVRRGLEWLFPARCTACELPLSHAPNPWFCHDCWEGLQPTDGPVCHQCGVSIVADTVAALSGWRCGPCTKKAPYFDMARVMGAYEGTLAHAVRQLKYRECTGIADKLVEKLDATCYPDSFWQVNLTIPVPLHPLRLRKRGYNQAARIAGALAKKMDLPLAENLLLRTRDTRPQVGLSRRARLKNLAGAFAVTAPEPVRGQRVLLVDDVVTTGATVGAAARALKLAGAKTVHVWALARQG